MISLANTLKCVLAFVAKTEVCSLVEQHADALVRELIAKTVFVRVVHPFGHPQEGQRSGQARRVSVCCRDEDNHWMYYRTVSRELMEKPGYYILQKRRF